jgi:competence protein ComEC
VHVLSVGNGTATVLQLPNGKTILYDLGSIPPYDLHKWTLGPFLAHEGIWSIDAVVLSHANLDHYCALPDLLAHHRVGRVIVPPHFLHDAEDSWSARRLLDEVKRAGVPLETAMRGTRLAGTGDVCVEALWPPPVDKMVIRATNDTGVVLRLSFGDHCVLLCGDIEQQPQEYLMGWDNLEADVLLLPHHGSVDASTGAFIRAVDPIWCIRSSGQPDTETQNGLLQLVEGRHYVNTAEGGAVEIVMSMENLAVRTYTQAKQRYHTGESK